MFFRRGGGDAAIFRVTDSRPLRDLYWVMFAVGVNVRIGFHGRFAMDTSNSLLEMVRRLRAGDDALADEVVHRFSRRLIGLARIRLNSRLRQKLDPEDVMQSVFQCFFYRLRTARLEVATWDNIWYLLTMMLLRDCAGRAEHFHAARRDARREVRQVERSDGDLLQLAVVEAAPDEALRRTESLDEAMRHFDAEDRAVIELSLQGCDVREICAQLGRPERSVRRLRERLRKRLKEQMAA